MPDIVFDNCVLSNFALSDSIFIVKSLYANRAYITDFVAAENMKGISKGYGKLISIREAVDEGWLEQTPLKTAEERKVFESLSISMGFGEASGIAVAKATGFVFACDDRAARREASLLGVRLTGTIGILIKAVKNSLIDYKEADNILKAMVSYGFYSPGNSIKEVL